MKRVKKAENLGKFINIKTLRSLDRVWVVIDEFRLDFEVEKHILYLLRNAEKDQVLVLSEMVLNDTVPNQHHNSTAVPLSSAFAALLEAAQSQLHVLDTTHMCTAVSG